MNYKKIIKNNYNLHIINTDRFKTINISINFSKDYNKEEYPYLRLLGSVLLYNGTNKYKSIKLINNKCEELYNLNFLIKSSILSNIMSLEYNFNIINPIYTDNTMYNESFDLINEIMNKPIIKNNMFNTDVFNTRKDNTIENIESIKDNAVGYSSILFNEMFYKGTIYSESELKNIDLYKKLDNKKLYKIYNSLKSEYKIDVIVIGNVDESIDSYISKVLNGYINKDIKDINLYINRKINKDIKCYMSDIIGTETKLIVGLNIDKLNDIEKNIYLLVYNSMLGLMNNSVLFVNVREKNSLCYSIGSSINRYTNSIVIKSGIKYKDFNKCINVINESLESMKDINVVKPLLNNAIKTIKLSYNDYYENVNKILNYYYSNELSKTMSISEKEKLLDSVTIEDVVNIANKVHMDTIYIAKGVNDEEN